ncbi:hypothetical protein [Sphingomonas sp. VNH70]|uniref:hypothetical protein n=1 Tax=Sphingomonas silueang TaxID=3156617 RepID=UPI0028EC4A7C|nr:hypothetical protein [uncultured Sphingomonas sp.]
MSDGNGDAGGVVLDPANLRAVALMVEWLDDKAVIEIHEAAEGAGPVADLAAEQMRARDLDF